MDHIKMHPELQAIFENHGIPRPLLPSKEQIALVRRKFKSSTARFTSSNFAKAHLRTVTGLRRWKETDTRIPVRDGSAIEARVYNPEANANDKTPVPPAATSQLPPLALMVHGGGGCMGHLDTEEFLCQYLCARLNMVVVNVAYRLYPDVQFPVPIYDVYDAMTWISANSSRIHADPGAGFIAAAVSGGGNLVVPACYLAGRDRNPHKPRLTGFLLLCTGMPHEAKRKTTGEKLSIRPGCFKSWEECKDAPLLNRETNVCFTDIADPDIKSPLFTPFLKPSHEGLPPKLYYPVTGLDPWRDSAIVYKEVLEKCPSAKTQVRMDIYPGLPHCWWLVYPQISVRDMWIQDLVDGVKWLLMQDSITTDHQHGAKL